MSDQFNWHIESEDADQFAAGQPAPHPRGRGRLRLLLVAGVLSVLALLAWQLLRLRIEQSNRRLIQATQSVLDLQRRAYLTGDGDLFFSTQADDLDWFSAQLHSDLQVAGASGLMVTRAEQHGANVWANLRWQEAGTELQRIAFFQWTDTQLIQVPTAPNYWGEQVEAGTAWGEIVFFETDAEYVVAITDFLDELVDRLCRAGCLQERLPVRLVLANQYGPTAVAGEVHQISPRLLALTKDGRPAPAFWRQLETQVEGYLTAPTIRFAVAPLPAPHSAVLMDFNRAAQRFMLEHPDFKVEVVQLDQDLSLLPDSEVRALLRQFDAISLPPAVDWIVAGDVLDLTRYALTDSDFDKGDFYEQTWQGAQWRERMWFMPLAAQMPVLFYDAEAFRYAGLDEPEDGRSWNDLTTLLPPLLASQPSISLLSWGLLDTGKDSLYGYAFASNAECGTQAIAQCLNQEILQPPNVTAALEWYAEMVEAPPLMPDLTELPASERGRILVNWQSARRRAAVWIDMPVNFENHFFLSPVGVAPFPGSQNGPGITPLTMQGAFISGHSTHPMAAWQWLKFLSYEAPAPRMIPARPSVARRIAYWDNLPPALADVMRPAFRRARPITISERDYFAWEQLAAVVAGELSPVEAAQAPPSIEWFAREGVLSRNR